MQHVRALRAQRETIQFELNTAMPDAARNGQIHSQRALDHLENAIKSDI